MFNGQRGPNFDLLLHLGLSASDFNGSTLTVASTFIGYTLPVASAFNGSTLPVLVLLPPPSRSSEYPGPSDSI